MAKISQKDIALALNISRVTVTKALQDHPNIAEKTKKLVRQKAAQLGYVPNLIGRSLSSNRTFTIGVSLPKIAHSFFSHSVEFMYGEASRLGYQIIPTISFESGENEKKNLETLISMGCEGIVVGTASGVTDYETYEFLNRAGVKLVFFDRFPSDYEGFGVGTNDVDASESITRFVISKGYKRIVCFAGPDSLSVGRDRLKGFTSAHEKTGREIIENGIVRVEMTEKDGYDRFIQYFITHGTPEAIVCVNDSVALGVYKAAAKVGVSIPGDMAVVGFGNLNSSRLVTPRLTTYDIPLERMCTETIQMLVNFIEGKEVKNRIVKFDGELVIRDSV